MYLSILHRFAIEKLPVVVDVQKQLSEKSRTRCFFDIGLKKENQKFGRIVFELYDTIVPRTCENFAAFCRGVNGLSYKCINYFILYMLKMRKKSILEIYI